jgi:membrane protein implicated in regulation of membrane protease activity
MMVDAGFYLVFLGVSAVAVGVVDIFWVGSPMWVEWLLFSLIAVVTLVYFRSKLYSKVRVAEPDRADELVGEVGVVEADIEAGGTGRIELRGSTWAARNVGDSSLRRDARARVDAISGLTVDIRAADA